MKPNKIITWIQTVTSHGSYWLLLAVVLALGNLPLRAEAICLRPPNPLDRKGAELLMQKDRGRQIQLPSELTIPELSNLAQAWDQQPKATHLVDTLVADQPARLAVHEVGTGSQVIVCLHGLFGEGSSWSYVAGALADDYQIWLIDLPGCGESDFIEPARDDVVTYSPTALAERVLQTLEARFEARPNVSRVLIAGHSLGGMITLRMLADDKLLQDYPSTLAKVNGLVLFAPSDVVVVQATEEWRAFLSLSGTKAWLGNALGMLQPAINRSLQTSFCDPSLATCELGQHGREVLIRDSERGANQAMMRSAIKWETFGEKLDWDAIDALEADYQNITTPCLIVWGRRDRTLPCAMGYKLKDQLPNARLVIVPQSMHLLPQERPSECASLIRDFDDQLRSGSLPVARSVNVLAPGALEEHIPPINPSLEEEIPTEQALVSMTKWSRATLLQQKHE